MTATAVARSVVSALLAAGVRELVLAPGSRNAPLAFACFDAAAAGHARLHTRIDERTAGFLALGLTKGGSRAAVVCTSGTAVANLHPAVLEAHHARVPLVVVTADRPLRLRGTDANQTTDQVGVFGPLVADPGRRRRGLLESRPALVHLNVQLDDPLIPEDRWSPGAHPAAARWSRRFRAATVSKPRPAGPAHRRRRRRRRRPLRPQARRRGRLAAAGRAVVGRAHRPGAAHLPAAARLLAGRRGRARRAVRAPDAVPAGPAAARPRPRSLDASPSWTRPYAVTPFPDPAVDGPDDPAWLAAWQDADASVSRQLDALLDEAGFTPYHVAGAVSRSLPRGGHLLVGASNPIRDLDLMATAYDVGSRRKVIANRGLSGIDGTVSTAIGASLARREGNRNLALMGDVTFLHDANGLVLGPDEPEPDLTIVVANDDGGSIFATLEQGGPEHAHAHERLFATPHHVDLAALCQATRTPHWRVDSAAELDHALGSPNGGIEVVEARRRPHPPPRARRGHPRPPALAADRGSDSRPPTRLEVSRRSLAATSSTTGSWVRSGSVGQAEHGGDDGLGVDDLVEVAALEHLDGPAERAGPGDLVGVGVAEGEVGAGSARPAGRYGDAGLEVGQRQPGLGGLDLGAGGGGGEEVVDVRGGPPLRPRREQAVGGGRRVRRWSRSAAGGASEVSGASHGEGGVRRTRWRRRRGARRGARCEEAGVAVGDEQRAGQVGHLARVGDRHGAAGGAQDVRGGCPGGRPTSGLGRSSTGVTGPRLGKGAGMSTPAGVIPYVDHHDGPKRVLTLDLTSGNSMMKASPAGRQLDGRQYVVYWGAIGFEIPADRACHLSVHVEGGHIGAARLACCSTRARRSR